MRNCVDYAYSHDDGVCQDQSNWMSNLNDDKKISQLSIPGTHNTMSLGWGGDIAQTQSKTLQNQLTSGIRFLDIRLALHPNSSEPLKAYRGVVYLYSSFTKIIDVVTTFLKNNASETIFMRIKQENSKASDENFIFFLSKVLNDAKYSNYVYNYARNINPYLKDVRGKLVILQNFGGEQKWIPYYNSFSIQDNYKLKNNWDLYGKWQSIQLHLKNANENFPKRVVKGYINYLTGSGGVFPYFVVSGQSSPGTNSPLLSTGLTEPGYKKIYPDFPRINRLGVFATIAFEGTNKLTQAFIDIYKPSYVGIIVTDFPGQGLINSIINVNKYSINLSANYL